jgi:phosphatidate phosphatase APP1
VDPLQLPKTAVKLPKAAVKSAAGKVEDVVRSPETAKQVSRFQDAVMRRRQEAKLEDGTLRGVRVIVHRGWVSSGIARIHVAVMESPELPGSSRIPYWDVLTTNLNRHVTLAFPGVKVRINLAGVTTEEETDRHGFAAFRIHVQDLDPGWHEVEARVSALNPTEPDFVGVGRILLPPANTRIAIISDIDDTVIRTGLDEGLTAFRRTMFGEADTRRSIKGMSSLYRGLSRGVIDNAGEAPGRPGVFYVSTGSWAFYEMLVQFLQLRGYPRGPLFLTDWGPSDRYLLRSGKDHKLQAIRRIADGYPDTPLVLIGDSGQQDPEIYTEIAAEYPGRIALILIISAGRSSSENTERWREKSGDLRDEGVPLHVIDNALEGARLCLDLGMCDELTVEEVELEIGAIF